MPDPFQGLADRIHGSARRAAHVHSRPAYRGLVVGVDPLRVSVLGSEAELVISEEDDDVEVSQTVIDHVPVVDDGVILHQDRHGDWMVTGIMDRG